MKWIILLTAVLLLLPSVVSAEDHYVTQDGGGDGSSSSSPWSVADFNNAVNWNSVVDTDDGHIGPGDTVYFGDITNTALYPQMSGALNNPIIFDGYEAGECDAHNTNCSDSAVISGTFFSAGEVSHLTFRDFVFTNHGSVSCPIDENPGCAFITACRGRGRDDTCKTTHITVTNNRFVGGGRSYGGTISFGFVTDWSVENNYYRGDGLCTAPGEEWHYGSREDFFGVRPGGARGRLINNYIIDSFHAYYNVISVDRNVNGVLDFPSSGSYRRDPEVHTTGLEIAYNIFDGWCEEGISFDDPSGSGTHEGQFPTIEIDTISSIDSGNNYIYLDNSGSEWTSVTEDRYSGLYLVNTIGNQERYGKIALIEDQYQNRFTLASSDISKFSVGDRVTVTLIQNKVWIHHNQMVKEQGSEWGWGPIWIEGNWFNGLIENNHIEPKDYGCNNIMLQSVHGTFINPSGVTEEATHNPTAFNLVRYNRAEELRSSSYPRTFNGWDFSYNNAWTDNILWETGDDCNELIFSKVFSYHNNNTYDGSGNPIRVYVNPNGGGLMTPDPTTGIAAGIYSQSHIGPNILSTHVSGTTLTITFTESVTGCSSGGNCGFSIMDSGGSVSLNQIGGSGATRTFTLGRALNTNANLFYDGTGNIMDSDGIKMYMWSIIGHDLNTEYNENTASTYECNDTIDNDGDGQIDLSDLGCSSTTDDDETNCGDGACEGGEVCDVCVADCGVCPTGNLIAHYTMDSDDIEGNQVLDTSGNDIHAAIHGNPQSLTGRVGEALFFDGVDDYLDTGYTDNLDNWAVSVWVMGDSDPAGTWDAGPVMKEENFILSWDHRYSPCKGAICLRVGTTWYHASFGNLVNDTWYHIVATYDGETLRAYKNGVLITENTEPSGNPYSSAHSMKIARHSIIEHYFTGDVDEVRVYNYALSSTEILEMYDSCFHTADDNPKDGCVEEHELVPFIDLWHYDSTAYPMVEVMQAVTLWSRGTGCVS